MATTQAQSDAKRPTFERRTSAWILLAAVGCFAALAAPFFAQRVYVADDLGEFHLPVRNFYAEQLRRGEPFDWMPDLYGGFYVAAEGQLGAYHPWHWLLYRFLPLGAAFGIELLASYPLLFAGTYCLLRRLIARHDAALLGALTFTFGGFSLLHFVHPNAIAVVAHLPWLLVGIDVALSADSTKARAVAILSIGLLTASQLLLGYPQYVWFSLLAETAFVVWRLSQRGVRQGSILARVGWLIVAVCGGVLAGAIQWLATWHLLGESVRKTSDAAFANLGSLHPLNLVQLLAPYLFQTRVVGQNTHELGLYIGAVPIVLFVWLIAHRQNWGRYRPLVRATIVFGILALLLAAGEFGGLYRLQTFVPLANRFRFPCRAIVLVQLALAVAAAVAAALLFARAEASRTSLQRRRWRPLWIAFLASVALATFGPLAWPRYVAGPLLVWTGPLLVGVAALLVMLCERGLRFAPAALALFTAVDLACYGLSHSVYGRTADLHTYVASIQRPPEGNPPRVVVLDGSNGLRVGDRMLLAGLSRVDGYAGLEPAKRLDYRDRRAWQRAGVSWVWQFDDADDAGEVARRWLPIAPTAPRARLATRTVELDSAAIIDAHDFTVAAVDPPLNFPLSTPGSARVVSDQPGRIAIETDAPAPQLLATTESYDSGWRVLIDGRPGTVVRVDGDFLGCPVPAGKHRIAFEFRPPSKRWGAILSACGLGLLVFAACWQLLRRPLATEEAA